MNGSLFGFLADLWFGLGSHLLGGDFGPIMSTLLAPAQGAYALISFLGYFFVASL